MDRLNRLIPALWAGVLLGVAGLAAPAAFATLDKSLAGLVVGWIFPREAWLSLVFGAALLLLERRASRKGARPGHSALTLELVLVFCALFCTVAGYFGLQPMMAEARTGRGPYTFAQLHLASTVFFGLKTLSVVLLAWRAAGPAVVQARVSE